jgi:hypothetical protein
MRNNRYRLPAKFYIILWTSMWAAAVGMFVMAFMEGCLCTCRVRYGDLLKEMKLYLYVVCTTLTSLVKIRLHEV